MVNIFAIINFILVWENLIVTFRKQVTKVNI